MLDANNLTAAPGAAQSGANSRRTAFLAYGIALLVVCWQVALVFWLGDAITPIADHHSESDAMRGSDFFLAQGLAPTWGLPDITYGKRFPDEGALRMQGPAPLVYTHYPPGPEWLLYLVRRVTGSEQIAVWRLLPILFGAAGMVLLARALIRALGGSRAAAAMAIFSLLPMFGNMMHGLHYQGYAFALLLIELALLMGIFIERRPFRIGGKLALFALGFAQGWLSFDYLFLVGFAAAPFFFLSEEEDRRSARRRLAWAVAMPLAGFVAAHALHFVQVALYFGGIHPAIADYVAVGTYRLGSGPVAGYDGVVRSPLREVVSRYSRILLSDDRYFGPGIPLALIAALWVAVTRRGRLEFEIPARWIPEKRAPLWKVVALVGGGILVWFGAIWNHPVIVYQFVSMNFAAYLLALAAIAAVLTVWRRRDQEAGPAACRIEWRASGSPLAAVIAAGAVSAAWTLVARNHAIYHTHFLPRSYFLLFFICVLALLRALSSLRVLKPEGAR